MKRSLGFDILQEQEGSDEEFQTFIKEQCIAIEKDAIDIKQTLAKQQQKQNQQVKK